MWLVCGVLAKQQRNKFSLQAAYGADGSALFFDYVISLTKTNETVAWLISLTVRDPGRQHHSAFTEMGEIGPIFNDGYLIRGCKMCSIFSA